MKTQLQADEPEEIEPKPPPGDTNRPQPWNLVARMGFRFSLAYLVLYAFPFPLDSLPFGNFLATQWANLWRAVVPWVGERVLHLSYKISVYSNGGGDTTFGYVKIPCFFVLAVIATIVWSIIDRRQNYA